MLLVILSFSVLSDFCLDVDRFRRLNMGRLPVREEMRGERRERLTRGMSVGWAACTEPIESVSFKFSGMEVSPTNSA